MCKIQKVSDEHLDQIMNEWSLREEQKNELIGWTNGILLLSPSNSAPSVQTKEKKNLRITTQNSTGRLLSNYDKLYPYAEWEEEGYDSGGNFVKHYTRSINWGADENTERVIELLREIQSVINLPSLQSKRGRGNPSNKNLKDLCIQLHGLYFKLTGSSKISNQPFPGERKHSPFTNIVALLFLNYIDKDYVMPKEDSFVKLIEDYLKNYRKEK